MIPKVWEGQTAFILGGGPTLPDSLAGRSLDDHNVLGVNAAYTIPCVDVCWFGDAKFYWWNKQGLDAFGGWKFTYNRGLRHGFASVDGQDGIRVVRRGKGRGLDMRNGYIGWNCSSGGSAINLAAQLGATRIILLGYDMRVVDGRKNWAPHEHERTKLNPYNNFLRPFGRIRQDAKRLGIQILNATPGSALRKFPFVNLDEVL